MPKYIAEIPQGNTFSLSAENGAGAFSATRVWKVILNSPNESYLVEDVTGVSIGDPYSSVNPIPCVKLEAKADGESRLVRIVTATYSASPGADPAVDPKTQEPTVRPALYSMSASLQEIASWSGKRVDGGVSGDWKPAVTPVGDLYDGVSRLEPVISINIDQYSYSDQSNYLGMVGYVNSDSISFSSLPIAPHCAMLQNVSSNPVVEQFGDTIFRGFKITFVFGVRAHWTYTRDGIEAIGWDIAQPQSGFRIINKGLNRSDVDNSALALEHENNKVKANPVQANFGLSLAAGTQDRPVRAMVTVPAGDGGYLQRVASQPVALNDDGTPRSPLADPPVLINRICMQPEMAFGNNFSAFGINSIG